MTTHMICSLCGSTDVSADAATKWDGVKGEWVLECVYDDRFCSQCSDKADLIEVDEAEGLEIQVSGMIEDGYNNFRLVEDDETPAFFDVMVRTNSIKGGEIFSLYEFDNLSKSEADKKLNDMIFLFPTAPINRFLGAGAKP